MKSLIFLLALLLLLAPMKELLFNSKFGSCQSLIENASREEFKKKVTLWLDDFILRKGLDLENLAVEAAVYPPGLNVRVMPDSTSKILGTDVKFIRLVGRATKLFKSSEPVLLANSVFIGKTESHGYLVRLESANSFMPSESDSMTIVNDRVAVLCQASR